MIEDPFGERWKTIPSAQSDRRFVILKRADGLFFFVEERFWPAEDEDIELGWRAEHQSGIFADAGLAEAEIDTVLSSFGPTH